MQNLVPLPSVDCTYKYPPVCLTIPYTVDNPKPVPAPISLVEKNGSKFY